MSQLVSQKSEDPIIALYGHVQELLRLKFTTVVTWVFSHFSIFRYPPYPHYKLVCKDALSLSHIMSYILNNELQCTLDIATSLRHGG